MRETALGDADLVGEPQGRAPAREPGELEKMVKILAE